jgi:transposase
MSGFIEGENRFQCTLFPESLDDYIAEDNAVRVVDAFVNKLKLKQLGFNRAAPSDMGRPGYEPATMLKIYIYGYLNRIQSSRRLERESYRNVELIWLSGRLMPCFKTIADFRRDNRQAIRQVCVEFVGVCRDLDLYSSTLVAIDGSKFKAVNSRDKNFTRKSVKLRLKKTKANIERYLAKLDAVDKEEPEIHEVTAKELKQKIASMEAKMEALEGYQAEVEAHPDKQVSLTDPDCRSMMKAGGGSTVGYNVQTAVDSKHHLIVAHEVTNAPTDRSQLSSMAAKARQAVAAETLAETTAEENKEEEAAEESEAATKKQALLVVADPGYYKGEEIVECYEAGITALVPKVDTSGSKAKGRFSKADFRYDAKANEYICPAGERLSYRYDSHEKGKTLWVYWTSRCSDCALKADCTTGKERRIKRWEKEHILEAADALLKKNPDAMRQRKRLVEHPFGTIKHWMGSTHFLTKRLPNVQAEMSLHVLTYNLRRAINILGTEKILEQLQAA